MGKLIFFTFALILVTFYKEIEGSPIPSIANPSKPSSTFETDIEEKTTTEGSSTKLFLGSSASTSEEQALNIAIRNRIKAQRLEEIKNRILNFVGHNQSPPSITPIQQGKKKELLDGLGKYGREPRPFSGQIQTFNAACTSPQNVDEEVWNSSEYFHVYFNVSAMESLTQNPIGDSEKIMTNQNETTLKPSVDTSSTVSPRQTRKAKRSLNFSILSSKIKIFKFGQNSDLMGDKELIKAPRPESSEPCNDSMTIDNLPRPTISLEEMFTEQEENIRISLYWYTQPLAKHHIKRKLLDTKMVSVKESKWIEFDIQKALKAWLEKGINYGLVIEVDNEDNDLLDANKYLANPCTSSEKTTISDPEKIPIPSNNLLLPVLDVCTLSIPSREPKGTPFFPISLPTSVITRNHISKNETDLTNSSSNSESSSMQNDGFGPIILTPLTHSQSSHHRHRHNHGANKGQKKNQRQTRKRNSHGGNMEALSGFEARLEREEEKKYVLDENHPLRQILLAGSPERRKKVNPELTIGEEQKSSENDGFSEEGSEHDTIIQKIYITPPIPSRSPSSDRKR